MTAIRQRLRTVSPERIARVAEALGSKVHGVRLQTDGSAVILTAEGAQLLPVDGGEPNEWDEVLVGSA